MPEATKDLAPICDHMANHTDQACGLNPRIRLFFLIKGLDMLIKESMTYNILWGVRLFPLPNIRWSLHCVRSLQLRGVPAGGDRGQHPWNRRHHFRRRKSGRCTFQPRATIRRPSPGINHRLVRRMFVLGQTLFWGWDPKTTTGRASSNQARLGNSGCHAIWMGKRPPQHVGMRRQTLIVTSRSYIPYLLFRYRWKKFDSYIFN